MVRLGVRVCFTLSLLLIFAASSSCTSQLAAPTSGDISSGPYAELETYTEELAVTAYISTTYPGPKHGPGTEYAKYVKQRFGINVDGFTWASGENVRKKISLFAASGEMPDLIQFGLGPDSMPDLQIPHSMADNGMLLNIEPYLFDSPNLMKYLTPTILDSYRNPTNNRLYILPNFTINEKLIDELTIEADSVFVVRADWLEKLNLEVPVTPDELYILLKAFKQQLSTADRPMIPYLPIREGSEIRSHLGAMFGIRSDRTAIDDMEQRMIDDRETPEYVSYLKYAASLYREGLIYPEVYKSGREDVLDRYIATSRVGLTNLPPGEISAINSKLAKLDPDARYVPIPLPKARGVGNSTLQRINQLGTSGLILSKKIKDPERLFLYLDWMASKEGWATVAFGPPSQTNGSWYIDEQGKLVDHSELARKLGAENPDWEIDVLGAGQYGLAGILKHTKEAILDQVNENDPLRKEANDLYAGELYMNLTYDIYRNLPPGPLRAEKAIEIEQHFEESEARIIMTSADDTEVTAMYSEMMEKAITQGWLEILKEDFLRYREAMGLYEKWK